MESVKYEVLGAEVRSIGKILSEAQDSWLRIQH